MMILLFSPLSILSQVGENDGNVFLVCLVWHLQCMWEWSLGSLWQRMRVEGSLLKLQAVFETEVPEPLTLPKMEDKDPSFRNWERSQIQRFCGRSWSMGTVSGATRLAGIFLQFRCWEFSPWIFPLGSRQPCWACIFPYCLTARHRSLRAVCERCLSNTGMTRDFPFGLWKFPVVIVNVWSSFFGYYGHVQFLDGYTEQALL